MIKLFYRKKGKYSDGRDRIVIEDKNNGTNKTLPKPEDLLKILETCTKGSVSEESFEGVKVSKNDTQKDVEVSCLKNGT